MDLNDKIYDHLQGWKPRLKAINETITSVAEIAQVNHRSLGDAINARKNVTVDYLIKVDDVIQDLELQHAKK